MKKPCEEHAATDRATKLLSYAGWQVWIEKKLKTHKQCFCHGCSRWVIFRRKRARKVTMKPGDTKMIRQVVSLPLRMSFTAAQVADQLLEAESQLRHALTKLPTAYHQFITGPLEQLVDAQRRLKGIAASGSAVDLTEPKEPRDAREQD